MEYTKLEAQAMLGIGNTSFYKYVKSLNIQMRTQINDKGKVSYIRVEDFERIMQKLGKTKEDLIQNSQYNQPSTSFNSHASKTNPEAEEWEVQEFVQEKFMLQLKIKEQAEEIKSNNQIIEFYKENNSQLMMNQQEAKNQITAMYWEMLGISKKATTYYIISIAVSIVLLLFVILVATWNLKF